MRRGSMRGLALEVIQYQETLTELEGIYSLMVDQVRKSKNEKEYLASKETKVLCESISNFIFNRFGIRTRLELDTGYVGAVYVLPVAGNHVLMKDIFNGMEEEEGRKRLIETFNGKTGKVDLERAHLSGIFSTYEHRLLISFYSNVLNRALTVKELVAITLHEIGHVFTYYLMSDRLVRVNYILNELSDNLKENNEQELHYRYKELSHALNEKEDYLDELVGERNRVILGAKLFKKVNLSLVSLMNDPTYSATNSEQLADMFSSRFGYYRDLVTGLDKLHLLGTVERNDTIYYIFLGTNIFWLATRPLAIAAGFMMGVGWGVLAATIALTIINGLGSANQDHTYDNVYVRYTRIREQLVNRLKLYIRSKEEMEDLLEQLDAIDNILAETRNYKGLVNSLSDFIFSRNRSAGEDIALQRTMEKLANNELYVMSARFKTL